MVRFHDAITRIQNGFRARLKLMAIPNTKMNFAIASILYQEGFIRSVVLGNHLQPMPGIEYPISEQRLWLDLKYKDGEPVLSYFTSVSKPSKRITMTVNELELLTTGRRAKFVEGLKPGEIAIVTTPKGVFEAREAIKKNTGGLVLARAK